LFQGFGRNHAAVFRYLNKTLAETVMSHDNVIRKNRMKEIESCELEKLRDVFCDLPCGVAVLKIGKTLECRFFNDAFT